MRELYLDSLTVTDEGGRTRHWDYCITVDEIGAGRFCCENYGVRVSERGGGSAAVRGITCSMDRIRELGAMLVCGAVSPVSLADVVEDWL